MESNSTLNNVTQIFTEVINVTVSPPRDVGEYCGANFCPKTETGEAIPNLEPPPNSKLNLIFGIYLICMIVASLTVAFGVDSVKRYVINDSI